MKAKIGQFLIAKAYFAQDSEKPVQYQRWKARPVLVLAAMLAPDGEHVYLCATLSTQTHKVHGTGEVTLTAEQSVLIRAVREGEIPKAGVCRFNKTDLIAIRESHIGHYLESYKKLPEKVQLALRTAAQKLANCPI